MAKQSKQLPPKFMPSLGEVPYNRDYRHPSHVNNWAETCHKKRHSAPMHDGGGSFSMLCLQFTKATASDQLIKRPFKDRSTKLLEPG
jgi:hypothetical protein